MEYLWAQSANPITPPVNTGVWNAVISASWPVQFTLLILVTMSVFCWAIIIAKKRQFGIIQAANEKFLELFWKAKSLDDIFEKLKDHPESNMSKVFKAGYLELRKIAESNLAQKTGISESGHPPLLSGLDNLDRALRKSQANQVANLESRLSFLATTGSTGPFIGLFGTVWGIMGAFQKIGETKMASLAVVAPGISEALVATAIGLAAAIPATVAYNHYVTNLRKEDMDLGNFSADFLNIAKRNFFVGA